MEFVRLNSLRELNLVRAVRLVRQSNPRLLMLSIGLIVLQGFVPVVPIYVVKLIVDAGTAGASQTVLIPLVLVAGGAILVGALLQAVSGYVREAQSQSLSDYVQGLIHAKSLELDLSFYEGSEFFDKLHRAQQEAPHRPGQVIDNLMSIFRAGISVVGIMAVLVIALPWYTVLLLSLSAIPSAAVRLVSSNRLFSWRMKRTPADRHVYYLNWLLTGRPHAKELRLFGLGQFLSDRSRFWRRTLRSERLGLIARRTGGEFAAAGFQAVVVVGLLAFFALESVRSATGLGNLVLFFQAVQKGQQVLAELLRGVAQLYETNLFLANAFDFLNLSPSLVPGDADLPPAHGSGSYAGLELENVRFSYPGTDRLILNDVSMVARPGELIAIVGDNGAGKSTLIKLLCRFYDPDSGSVRINGRDLRALKDGALFNQMAVLFQDHAQYFYSARENIQFGNLERGNDEAGTIDAAERAGAHEFIARLPKSYDTVLGRWLEEGTELSGGQWKKVALARTLFRDAPFVLLDEPTAGLDPESEANFIDSLRDLAAGRLLIIVSHKIASAVRADRIYVMRDGSVIEHGSHGDLVNQGGYYAGLYRTQLRQIQDDSA